MNSEILVSQTVKDLTAGSGLTLERTPAGTTEGRPGPLTSLSGGGLTFAGRSVSPRSQDTVRSSSRPDVEAGASTRSYSSLLDVRRRARRRCTAVGCRRGGSLRGPRRNSSGLTPCKTRIREPSGDQTGSANPSRRRPGGCRCHVAKLRPVGPHDPHTPEQGLRIGGLEDDPRSIGRPVGVTWIEVIGRDLPKARPRA